ncbi:hypothetical protein FOA52_009422, partial [Chlamydomonas sp. UWO 241]
ERLEETKLIQRQRKKAVGTDASKLALVGSDGIVEEVESEEDEEDYNLVRLMNSYVKETGVRKVDDDKHMEKYVEEEVARRLGKRGGSEELDEAEALRRQVDADLYNVPKHLQ